MYAGPAKFRRCRRVARRNRASRPQGRKRKARHLGANGLSRSRAPAEHGNTRVAQTVPILRADQTTAEGARGILSRHENGHGTVAAHRRQRLPENGKDTDAAARRRSSQTYCPLKIFLARATRNKSASLSASERASLRQIGRAHV